MDRSEKGLVDESTLWLQNPYPAGIKTLADDEQICRLRVGDYRILYQVKETALLIVGIGQRREFYRRIVR